MNTTYAFKELSTYEAMKEQYPLLQQLNPHLLPDAYEQMLREMLPNGYQQVVVMDGDKCIALSGYWINTKIYCGKYIEMDNVIVDVAYRSKGIGQLLCQWIREKGKATGCVTVLLDVYASNRNGQRFYFREGFGIDGFHMSQAITK